MAQRDLDAALQLLADRAQYITGSTGAAIALRRRGRNDMLCRATAGSNAPELGALLSTEFGLSGESVRTRQLLRCDDIERDGRVNREACRRLGIASVAVMPVVNDDEVLGVFELFSGKANAFGERDLTALKRLSELVETAVKLARVAEQLPEPLMREGSAKTETARPKPLPPPSWGKERWNHCFHPIRPKRPQSLQSFPSPPPRRIVRCFGQWRSIRRVLRHARRVRARYRRLSGICASAKPAGFRFRWSALCAWSAKKRNGAAN
jgi:hypothetical protein